MTNNPFFSVVIPTYNRDKFIVDSVNSVLAQTFTYFELIVIDDGSTDDTERRLREVNDKRISYFYQDNSGVSIARNRGIKESRGEYIAFLDSDDIWKPEKLEITLKHISESPDIKIFHTNEIWYRNGKLQNQKKKYRKPDGYAYYDSLPVCCIGMSTSVVKKDLFDEIGMFDESMPACEDYDLWLRATCKYEVKLIEEPLIIKYGGRPDQLSSQPGLDKYRIQALEKMLDSGVLCDEQHEETRKELINKCRIYCTGFEKRGKLEEADYYIKLLESL